MSLMRSIMLIEASYNQQIQEIIIPWFFIFLVIYTFFITSGFQLSMKMINEEEAIDKTTLVIQSEISSAYKLQNWLYFSSTQYFTLMHVKIEKKAWFVLIKVLVFVLINCVVWKNMCFISFPSFHLIIMNKENAIIWVSTNHA